MNKDEASAPEGGDLDLAREMFRRGNMLVEQPPIMTMVEQRKIQAVLAAYDKALGDAHARLPTYLHAAISALVS